MEKREKKEKKGMMNPMNEINKATLTNAKREGSIQCVKK